MRDYFISDVPIDLLFHPLQLPNACRVKMPLVHEGLNEGHEFRAEMRSPATGRALSSHFFPGLSKAGIVGLIGQERQGQLALRAVWAQAQIDTESFPLRAFAANEIGEPTGQGDEIS